MLRQRSFLGVLTFVVLTSLLIQPTQAQEPRLGVSEHHASQSSAAHNILVYYAGAPVLEPLYQSTLSGLSGSDDAIVQETADPVFFEEQLTTGAFDVMIALTTDHETIEAWRTALAPVPILMLCTDGTEDEFELQYIFYAGCSWEDSPYEPAGDASWSPTAPAEGDGDVVTCEDMFWLWDVIVAVGKTLVSICDPVRQWVADRLNDLGDILEDVGANPKVRIGVGVPDGKGGFWFPVKIIGKGNVVSLLLHKTADLIEP